ncbi:putative ATP-dependent endonuclease of OLD family [Streptomyces sp. 840.1]|uniref:ATP-dependent nuclease n=1 Tax=Streptomyces sp. 840.1 TaxID=2485152 RepID=UPI000FA59B71|nr:AAA family ATPase [Streptomyces sp. 840.1]ROQ69236.1 putative ATP-dependent endonuclease of OLD family [Streptomyces sp. 840.1]
MSVVQPPQPQKQAQPPTVTRVEVKNFRLLRNVSVTFDEDVTVCVGRNNTGKTSLAEVLSRFLRPGDLSLRLEDFSAESYFEFADAYRKFSADDEAGARKLLPEISVKILLEYDSELGEYGNLGPLIVDLDPDCTQAIVTVRYALKPGSMRDFFRDAPETLTGEWGESLLLSLVGPRIPHLYERIVLAIDPTDDSNFREISMTDVAKAIKVDFVKAQRGLDDEKDRPKDQIGKILESLFMVAAKADDGSILKEFADGTEKALEEIVERLNAHLQEMYRKMAPTVSEFGYPGLGNRDFSTRTTLDSKRLLSNFTSINYPGSAGVELPESYSGLGSRNLLLILLTLFSYYREYSAQGNRPSVHLVFIEEPEAHLHPQMQEIFIHQLGVFKEKFPGTDGQGEIWNAQFLVTTHSAHIANRAGFSAIRYFRLAEGAAQHEAISSTVLNLAEAPGVDKEFLHKYLTLTRADLFFADKAILIEGTTERIFIPAAIAAFDESRQREGGAGLSSQYVSVMEVGGAHAHIFYPFLDFLGLQTLVITDLDPAKMGSKSKRLEACCVHDGTATTNQAIKKWFGDKELSPADLLKDAQHGIPVSGRRGLAYQIPESNISDPCGRTFEDAFILANPELFDLSDSGNRATGQRELDAREEAKKYKKSDFALTFAIEQQEWRIPRYIARGLDWLLDQTPPVEGGEGTLPDSQNPSSGQVVVR